MPAGTRVWAGHNLRRDWLFGLAIAGSAGASVLGTAPSDAVLVMGFLVVITHMRRTRSPSALISVCFVSVLGYLYGQFLGSLFLGPFFLDIARSARVVLLALAAVVGALAQRVGFRSVQIVKGAAVGGALLTGLSLANLGLTIGAHRAAGWGGVATGLQESDALTRLGFNEVGAIHALVAVACALCWQQERGHSATWVLLMVVNVAGLAATGSRSAFLALVVGACFVLWGERRRRRERNMSMWAPLAASSTGMALAGYIILRTETSTGLTRLSGISTLTPETRADIGVRTGLWVKGATLWLADASRVLVGYGEGVWGSEVVSIGTTDSFFIDRLVTGGIVSLLTVGTILGWMTVRVARSRDDASRRLGLLVVFVAFTVSVSGNVLFDPSLGSLVFFLMGHATARALDRDYVTPTSADALRSPTSWSSRRATA